MCFSLMRRRRIAVKKRKHQPFFLFLNKACNSFHFTRLCKINMFSGQVLQQRTAKMQLLVVFFFLGIYESCCDGILETD